MRTPRPYQTTAVARALDCISGQRSGILTLATGLGKTVVACLIAKKWDFRRGLILFLAHRDELLDQAARKFQQEIGYEPVIEQADRGWNPATDHKPTPIIVGSVASMKSIGRLEKYRRWPIGLVIVDECHHHKVGSMYARVVDFFREINPKLALLGVTATPLRHDKVSMGLCYDEDVFQFGIGPAIDDGWLVPVQQQYVEVGDVVFERVPVVRNSMGEADFKSSDLEFQMMQDEALVQVCIPILEQARNSQGLIFSAGVAHAHALASWLNSKRPGCAAAVDGRSCPPGSDRRTQIDRDFRQGAIQFIVNCDTHTEGFDHPPVAMIAMARPTKSLSKYTQQVGRGTRALDGIVDGPSTAEERRAAIAASLKPHVLIMDFVGNSGTHKLVSMVDVLGGNYDDEVRERAASNGKNRAARDPRTLLQEAQIELEFHRETERLRKQLKPRVKYDTRNVSPFVDGNGKFVPVNHLPVDNQARGGATDKQIDLLMKFGVPIETASKYSVKQAGVVISNLKASRCTNKQKLILERQGFSTEGVNYEAARGLIDQIANSGWQLRGDTVHS